MGVYRVKVKGREGTILLRAKSKTEAIDALVVEAKALTGEEVEEALAEGAKLWKPDEALPVELSDDVRRLVIAARVCADGPNTAEEIDLFEAVEPFAELVAVEDADS